MARTHGARIGLTSAVGVAAVLLVTALIVTASPRPKVDWKDPPRDAALANADLLGGVVSISSGKVDFRVTVSARPFPDTATHFVTWCLDTDLDPETGAACGYGPGLGADAAVALIGVPGQPLVGQLSLGGAVTPFDPRPYLAWDSETSTLRLLVPAAMLSGPTAFHYVVESTFGGSGGLNDRAPRTWDFARGRGCFATATSDLPFGGSPWLP